MPKTLIFLFDGTANDASETADTTVDSYSNVYRINQIIGEEKIYREGNEEKKRTQISFYMPGVGTRFTVWRPKKSSFWRSDRVRQKVFGEGAEQLILRSYINLCSNFKSGDDIILIGFSRGAAAARIFSRLISDFGILISEKLSLLDRLWNEFIRISKLESDELYLQEIEELFFDISRSTCEAHVFHPRTDNSIKFMGLFDTVTGALDSELRRNLDFRDNYPARGVRNLVHILSMHDVRKEYEFKRFDRRAKMPEVFREIWLPGVHSDVGGGYQDDFVSNVALLTMADFLKNYGGVSLEKSAYEKIEKRIKKAVSDENVTINREPFVVNRESRYEHIYADDEIHPLHYYLVGKKIRWKGNNGTVYENRHQKNTSEIDQILQDNFKNWIRI